VTSSVPRARQLAARTTEQIDAVASTTLLAVPVGATEQHGPHLALGTDTCVAVAIAHRLAQLRSDVLVAPALPYGASGEHGDFAGTLSIGHIALEAVLVELTRSADVFRGLIFVSGHGGNATSVQAAVTTAQAEGRPVIAWHPRVAGGDAHAGRTETSMMLAIDKASVLTARARPGDVRPLASILRQLRETGVRAVSPSGVLGDPTGASAAEGEALLQQLATDLARAVQDRWP